MSVHNFMTLWTGQPGDTAIPRAALLLKRMRPMFRTLKEATVHMEQNIYAFGVKGRCK